MCESELFVERAVQEAKSSCKYRAHAFPEPTIARSFLLRNQVLVQQVNWAHVLQALGAPAGQRTQLPQEDAASDASPSHMLGVGKPPDGVQLEVLKQAALQGLSWQPASDSFLHGWQSATEEEGALQYKVYQRAALRGVEIVHAESYKRSDKPSCFCLVLYEEAQREGPDKTTFYVARIKWFVKVTLLRQQLQPNGPLRTERFAIADLLPLELITDPGGNYFEHKLKFSAPRDPASQLVPNIPYASYPVGLEDLKRKLVWCPYDRVKVHMLSPPKHWLFGQYFHRTSYVDAESATEF